MNLFTPHTLLYGYPHADGNGLFGSGFVCPGYGRADLMVFLRHSIVHRKRNIYEHTE